VRLFILGIAPIIDSAFQERSHGDSEAAIESKVRHVNDKSVLAGKSRMIPTHGRRRSRCRILGACLVACPALWIVFTIRRVLISVDPLLESRQVPLDTLILIMEEPSRSEVAGDDEFEDEDEFRGIEGEDEDFEPYIEAYPESNLV
jgi:hypothetical protein